MAKRRMFSLDVVDTDRFINMSQKARYLYYELGLRADDDGFVGAPLKIARMIECTSMNLDELINNDFLIQFKSGVIAISEWRRNNSIRKDMYRATIYKEEYSELVEVDGVYIINLPNNVTEHVTKNVTDNVTNNVTKNDYVTPDVTCNVTLGKDRLGEVSEVKDSKEKKIIYCDDYELDLAIKNFIDFRKNIKKPMTEKAIELLLNKLNKETKCIDIQVEMLNQSIMNGWSSVYPIKLDIRKTDEKSNQKDSALSFLLDKIESEGINEYPRNN